MKLLENKVAIITGGSKGMGLSHVKKFLAEGAKVAFTSTSRSAKEAQKMADNFGENALYVEQDVTVEESWDNLISQVMNKWGRIDILINNAGITMKKSIFDMNVDDYLKIVRLNQLSVFLGMKKVAKIMKDQGSGSIVNISSIDGLVGGALGYTDTKFAVTGMTKAAALELAPYNIRVNSVHPGVVDTPMIHQDNVKDSVQQFIKTIPMQRVAEPEDVSKMVCFLASDESSYSTGSSFVVDGGLLAK